MANFDLPPRMFAKGHEPVGIRVQAYHPSRGISRIISALDVDEVEYIRQSPFGKLLAVADKPSFSGRFLRFLLSRMLKVNKKHEVWFLFCGRPIRFSLREFAIVTGLPCSEFPKKSKRKLSNMISEKSNWGSLFGTLKSISVKMVIKMLRKKKVTDRTTRLKYACLAILDSVILPTTHKHKISKEHAEAIKDLDEFLAYPWGRVAFDMLLSSITDRDEVSLSQPTLALKGFVHAIQLVIVEAVPLLNEVVQPKTNSDSESEWDSDETEVREPQPPKVTLNPSHARTVHEEEEAIVDSIIPDTNEIPLDETMFTWSDETVDTRVDTMVQLLAEEYEFRSNMFDGGLTVADLERMRQEAKLKKDRQMAAKNKVPSAHSTTAESSTCKDDLRIPPEDIQRIADSVALRLSTQLIEKTTTMETNIDEMRHQLIEFKSDVTQSLSDFKMELVNLINSKIPHCVPSSTTGPTASLDPSPFPESEARKDSISDFEETMVQEVDYAAGPAVMPVRYPILNPTLSVGLSQPTAEPATVIGSPNASQIAAPVKPTFPTPTFSLGLTQQLANPSTETASDDSQAAANGSDVLPSAVASQTRTIPYGATLDFLWTSKESDCLSQKFPKLEKKLLAQFELSVGDFAIKSRELKEVYAFNTHMSTNVMNALLHHTCNLLSNNILSDRFRVDFLDNKFVSSFMRGYSKFNKLKYKEKHAFPKSILTRLGGDTDATTHTDRFYIPLHTKTHSWKGLCVDFGKSTIYVLDPNSKEMEFDVLRKEVQPYASMFPYALQRVFSADSSIPLEEFAVELVPGLQQYERQCDSGIATLLLMHAHAVAGADECRRLTNDVLQLQAKKFLVTLYEEHRRPLV